MMLVKELAVSWVVLLIFKSQDGHNYKLILVAYEMAVQRIIRAMKTNINVRII